MASITKRLRGGRRFWEARINLAGHPAMSKSFDNKQDAVEWAQRTEIKIKGGDKVTRKAEKTTVAEALDEYLKAHATTDANGDVVSKLTNAKRYAVQSVSHHLGEFSVEALDRKKIKAFLDKLQETLIPPPANKTKTHPLYDGDRKRTYSPSAVRKLFYALKTGLEWHALEHGYSLGEKFSTISAPPAWSAPRERRLNEDEEKRLLDACDGMYKDPEGWRLLISFALETAMRAGEILSMQWNEINEIHRFVIIPKEREKTRRGRQVPLSKSAQQILTKLRKRAASTDGRVFESFPESTVLLGRGFKRITTRAECEDLRFHDLRHEATSRFFERTQLQTMEIALITGHTELKTLQRYANLRPAILASKLDAGIPVLDMTKKAIPKRKKSSQPQLNGT